MAKLQELVKEETLRAAGFDGYTPTSHDYVPPFGKVDIYIGMPRHFANIILFAGTRGEQAQWYLDVFPSKPLRDCSEREVGEFYQHIRDMVPLGKRVEADQLEERITALAEHARKYMI